MADVIQWMAEDFCRDRSDALPSVDWLPGKRPDVDRGPLQGVVRLVRAIETEIIPRLVLARREHAGSGLGIAIAAPTIEAAQVEQLTTLILGEDSDDAAAFVTGLIESGASVEKVYLALLAPSARLLGEMWCSDRIDFTQVTIGVGRLQMLLRRYSPEFMEEQHEQKAGRRILLLPAPGEQHSFGLVMVAEFFRRAGWEVWCDAAQANNDVGAIVSHQAFSIAGFSLSSATRADGLASQIHAIRRVSLNKSIGVLVGGHAFDDSHDLAGRLGADAVAQDGLHAVELAEEMLGLLRIQC